MLSAPASKPPLGASPRGPRPGRTLPRGAALAITAVVVAALVNPLRASAAEAVNLGTAGSFAVLAGAGITNTGPTTITGDVGSYPTTSQSGFDDVTLDGENHGGDAVTQQAKADLTTAYDEAAGSGPATTVATELGGSTLKPGVYNSLDGTFGITGTLTLDTEGDPNAVFIFQAASTLITASDSSVIVLDGAEACNVFWQVGSSATLGTDSSLVGSVLASESITANARAIVQGRLLARNGAVTLDTNTITNKTCPTPEATTTTTTLEGATTTTPGGATGDTTTATTLPGSTTATSPAPGGPTESAGGPTPTTTVARTAGPGGGVARGVPRGPGGDTDLATTGFDRTLFLLGGLAIAMGWFLLRLSSVYRRKSSR